MARILPQSRLARRTPARLWRGTLALVIVGATALALLAYAVGALDSLELRSVDARFAIRGSQGPPDDIAIVQIDDATFDELGIQWPFPRALHARVIGRLRSAGAAVVAYDVQFTEPSASARDDEALVAAVSRTPRIVLSTTEVDEHGATNVLWGRPNQLRSGVRVGNTQIHADSDHVIRRMAHTVNRLTNFAVVTAGLARGRPLPRDALPAATAPIDFAGPPGTVRHISFSRVLDGSFDPALVRGRTVVVGASASSLQDLHATSAARAKLMSGAEIEANETETALRGFPLAQAPGWLDVALIVAFGLLAPWALVRLSPLVCLGAGLALAGAYLVAAQLLFDGGEIIAVVHPLGALALTLGAALSVRTLEEAVERERVRDLFGRFAPAQVVEQAIASADGDLRLAGTRLQATVMFSDLRGFTSFAEKLDPALVIQILNRYLADMSDAIMGHGGTLVTYLGDGIMAVFGAPVAMDDHADRALAAAREMLTRLDDFNSWLGPQVAGDGFRIGIGLNTGTVMSGNVGSARRLEYTAIGDTTNIASRLQGMTKGTPHQVLIAASTVEALASGADGLVALGELPLRGRSRGIDVYTRG
ncbi:MAG: adenylate cyclase [bacterium]